MTNFRIRSLEVDDRNWVADLLSKFWGSTKIVTRGKIYQGDELPGFVAVRGNQPVGLITYRVENSECEIMTLNSLIEGEGIGSTLIETVKSVAISKGCKRLWLVTTNDNVNALRFYQKRGFQLVAIYRNAIEQYRQMKPEIAMFGIDSIPIRDEIELEIVLES